MSSPKPKPLPPRDRILAAAGELFQREGIRGVGVEAIAEAAATNKMTLYRHFGSKDKLVAAWIEALIHEYDNVWSELAARHPGDPRAQIAGFINDAAAHMCEPDERGCPMSNSMAELPERDHPARRVIERHKTNLRRRIIGLCRQGGIADAELTADQLLFLLEGARVCTQSLGKKKVAERLRRMVAVVLRGPETGGASDKMIRRRRQV